jgi:hypothetical protein
MQNDGVRVGAMIEAGQRVTITAAVGTCTGWVEALTTPPELPDIPGIEAAQAREILGEWNVSHVAIISYNDGRRDLTFCALRTGDRWYDLRRQRLEIEPIP